PSATSRKKPRACVRAAAPRWRKAGCAKRTCRARGLSTTAPPPRSILEANPLEQALCAADGAVERIGVARAVCDYAIGETLAGVPRGAGQLRQGLGVTLRPLAVPEVEGLRNHVRQADREGQQSRHQVHAEEAESEPHAAVAGAVAAIDQADQGLGRGQ